MRELGRVFGRRTLMLLAVLGIMNLVLFLLCADPDKEVTLKGEALEWYVNQYPDFLKSTEKNSDIMASLQMYQSGFARENLKKIRSSYQALEGNIAVAGDNTGIVLLIQYELTDLFLVVFLFSIVMEFRAESKKGLTYMIRGTVGGRGALFLKRICILAVASLFGAALFYGSNLAGSMGMGLGGLDRSLQSLPEFMKCPYRITIGEYLLVTFFLKIFTGFLLAMFIYVLMGLLGSGISYPVFIVLMALEIVAGKVIPPVSSFNYLRYLNFYTLLQGQSYYQDCIYLNLFGRPVSALSLMLWIAVLLLAILLTAGFFIYGRKYMVRNLTGEKLFDKLERLKEKYACQRTLMGWESYKLLVKQWGLLILLGVFLVHLSVSVKYKYCLSQDVYENLYYIQFHGELTQENMESAERTRELLVKAQHRLEAALQKIMEKEPLDQNKYYEVQHALATNLEQQKCLGVVMEDMESGREYTLRTGRPVYLINPNVYHMLFNLDEKTVARASFLILVGIVGSIAGVFAYDRQNNMDQWIHTSYRGRVKGVICKLGVVLLLCGGICIILHGVQVVSIQTGMDAGFHDLEVPVQSIPFMRDFPLYVSIRMYLILLFGVRAGAACLLGLIIAGISSKCQDVVTAVGFSTFTVSVLIVLGDVLPGGQWINPLYMLGGSYFR